VSSSAMSPYKGATRAGAKGIRQHLFHGSSRLNEQTRISLDIILLPGGLIPSHRGSPACARSF
jgi:hypothetical protein